MLMNCLGSLQLLFERLAHRRRQDGDAIFLTLAIAHDDLAVTEVDVFDAEPKTIHQAQTGPVQQLRHQTGGSIHVREHTADFVAGQDDRQTFRSFGTLQFINRAELQFQDLAVEKHQRAESLIVRRRGNFFIHGEVIQEGRDFALAHRLRMAFLVKEDVALRPVDVSFFGADGIMFGANDEAKLVEEFWLVSRRVNGETIHGSRNYSHLEKMATQLDLKGDVIMTSTICSAEVRPMNAFRLVTILALILAGVFGKECRSDEAAAGTVATTNTVKTAGSFKCPKCQGVVEALPRLGGPVTPDGYKLNLAGKAVGDGSCLGSGSVHRVSLPGQSIQD